VKNNINPRGLLNALRQLVPSAIFVTTHEEPWHSLTFSGAKLRILATFLAEDGRNTTDSFVKNLPDYQFDIPGQLVADITASADFSGNGISRLVIEALLLED
jgi:hypothetical protein